MLGDEMNIFPDASERRDASPRPLDGAEGAHHPARRAETPGLPLVVVDDALCPEPGKRVSPVRRYAIWTAVEEALREVKGIRSRSNVFISQFVAAQASTITDAACAMIEGRAV